MGYVRKVLIVTVFAFALPLARAGASTSFDGEWNVRIASSNAACGNGSTVSIGISNGLVASSNTQLIASGRVADAGNISVTLSSGVKRAVGLGRLSGSSGSGTWRGTMCSGTWTAQRM
ncbi:MAG: hypothetical protein HY852_00560 [Bradyrhizobium sp.]|uniref:hypothetical protein n=1 Tax=Bradyrhizobium sp. TaxID=376 RepID=UPI0025B862F6|nr:hypothetical protein [Bradyrhizobium sp.]MBI5260293.1 hypothetical protein [Bradyrhizobium sp.]